MYLQCPGITQVVGSPHFLHQELAAEHLAWVGHEGLEQTAFYGSEMMHSIVPCNQPVIQVQSQSVDLQNVCLLSRIFLGHVVTYPELVRFYWTRWTV